ncbi:hypothetical protein EN850_20805 [Mesorhizobium sp. M8A.F.Ca.ET.207.01.1.1]|uniref:DUF6074 family protein n=1 Tax=Mesorhizobium sp. M8A.F.Ca.ET.207.01.1.1 TaxID=2563968 RepID=UPI00109C05B1|nr:DUF6074 family protein [Mesorhizobium sp. M8A.F.Ca.ET.207.01.1.1]TGQ79331.1 hypothetical protein EN850_20805 [Mesorhizobium sp. M8A.F.Ca.ET.207.01.1.1]
MKKRRSDTAAQLDLFTVLDRPANAEIIAFPAERMVGLMREIASELLTICEKPDRDLRYREMVRPLRAHLGALSLPPEDVRRHMDALRAGVAAQARKQLILSILHDQRGDAA